MAAEAERRVDDDGPRGVQRRPEQREHPVEHHGDVTLVGAGWVEPGDIGTVSPAPWRA